MQTRTILCVLIGLLTLSFLVSGCDYFEDTTARRQDLATSPEQPITFGVAWPFSEMNSHFREGIQMAVEEINANGGINGRKLNIVCKDDHRDVTQGRLIAQQFADNPEIFAVIGHYNSYVSIPASSIYQLNNLLMLNPASTSPDLTSSNNDLVFRSIPNDALNAKLISRIVQKHGHKNVAILYEESSYGRGLANPFHKHAQTLNINTKDRTSYTPGELDSTFFGQLARRWKRLGIDAVIFAGNTNEAGQFLRHIHENDFDVPLYTGDATDPTQLWDRVGEHANGIITLTSFHPDRDDPRAQKFVKAFKKQYGHKPDAWAAQGYDAVYLLAEAIRRADSAQPHDVAKELGRIEDYGGVTGKYSFDSTGDLIGNPMEVVILEDGKLRLLNGSPPSEQNPDDEK